MRRERAQASDREGRHCPSPCDMNRTGGQANQNA
jgi:hypothetical protein